MERLSKNHTFCVPCLRESITRRALPLVSYTCHGYSQEWCLYRQAMVSDHRVVSCKSAAGTAGIRLRLLVYGTHDYAEYSQMQS